MAILKIKKKNGFEGFYLLSMLEKHAQPLQGFA